MTTYGLEDLRQHLLRLEANGERQDRDLAAIAHLQAEHRARMEAEHGAQVQLAADALHTLVGNRVPPRTTPAKPMPLPPSRFDGRMIGSLDAQLEGYTGSWKPPAEPTQAQLHDAVQTLLQLAGVRGGHDGELAIIDQ